MITGRKILCAAAPAYGHMVPTLALGRELQRAGNHVQMLSSNATMQDLYARYEMSTVPIDVRSIDPLHNLLAAKEILEAHRPDVTICDWGKDLWLGLQAWRPACRISVLRCEVLFGYQRRNLFLSDKFPFEIEGLVDWLNECLA